MLAGSRNSENRTSIQTRLLVQSASTHSLTTVTWTWRVRSLVRQCVFALEIRAAGWSDSLSSDSPRTARDGGVEGGFGDGEENSQFLLHIRVSWENRGQCSTWSWPDHSVEGVCLSPCWASVVPPQASSVLYNWMPTVFILIIMFCWLKVQPS